MRLAIVLALLFVATQALADCHLKFEKLRLCGKIAWQQGPHTYKESVLTISFFDLDEQQVAKVVEQELFADLFMPEHGHGSAPLKLNQVENKLKITKAYFTMPGTWQVRVKVMDHDKLVDQATHSLKL